MSAAACVGPGWYAVPVHACIEFASSYLILINIEIWHLADYMRFDKAEREMADGLLSSTFDKVILIGDVGVGKTSIFTRFRTGEFESSGDQKIAEFQKKWSVGGKEVTVSHLAAGTTFQLWVYALRSY